MTAALALHDLHICVKPDDQVLVIIQRKSMKEHQTVCPHNKCHKFTHLFCWPRNSV